MLPFKTSFTKFLQSERGAVTVDWVVLTAALVGLGLAVMTVVRGGVQNVSDDISTELTDMEVTTSFTSAAAPFEVGNWEANNPGIYDSYAEWMAGFTDENLLAHMNNQAQYASTPLGSGHPYDTYHDEFWIARDEAVTRGLIPADEPLPDGA